jgi:hypothetical protein
VIKLTDILSEILTEKKLCPKGRAYYNRRIAAGEKPSAYLSGRAVKVCKGLMKEDEDNFRGIDPSEAYNDVDAIDTLKDKKRDVAFIVAKSNTPENWKYVQKVIQDNGIKVMYVKGNPYDAYVAYLPGSENKATQLKDLAEKYGGYLASNATADDARKIGKLLGYQEDKIEQYIKDRNINESLRDWFEKEDWVRIDTQGNITGPCGTMKKGKATTRCLPRAKANSLTKDERAATARKKVAGSKKGKQFVSNTKKAKVKLRKEARVLPLVSKSKIIDDIYAFNPYLLKTLLYYNTIEELIGEMGYDNLEDYLKDNWGWGGDPLHGINLNQTTAKNLITTYYRTIKPDDIKIVNNKTSVAGYAYIEEICSDDNECVVVLTKF